MKKWVLVLLLLFASIASVAAQPFPVTLPINNASVSTSNFNHYVVYSCNSKLNPVEYDQVFVDANNSDVFIGVRFYNPSLNESDTIYLDNAVGNIYHISVNKSVAVLYNGSVEVGKVPLYNLSSRLFYSYIVKVPWSDIGVKGPFSLYITRNVGISSRNMFGMWGLPLIDNWHWRHCHHWRHCWWIGSFGLSYPEGAVLSNTSTWLHYFIIPLVSLPTPPENLTVHVSKVTPYMALLIYNLNAPIFYEPIAITTSGNYTVPVFNNVTNYAIVLGGNLLQDGSISGITLATGCVNVSLENYTNPTLNIGTYSVGGATFSIAPNVSGKVYSDLLELNSSNTTDVFGFASGKFVVMRARLVRFNPLTDHWRFEIVAGRTVYVKSIESPVSILMAPVLRKVEMHKFCLCMNIGSNGTVILSNPNSSTNGTFAVAHNGFAMRRYYQYRDMGNITVINATPGNLSVYYKNPCKLHVSLNLSKNASINVTINTPYTFHGKVIVVSNGKVVFSENITVRAGNFSYSIPIANLTSSTTAIDAAGSPIIKVYDLDSQRWIGAESLSIAGVSTALVVAVVATMLIAVVAASIYLVRKHKKAMINEIENRGKYFRKI